MLETQPKAGGGGGGETREEAVMRQVKALQAKLPGNYKADDVRDAIKRLGGAKPLNICLQQARPRTTRVLAPHSLPAMSHVHHVHALPGLDLARLGSAGLGVSRRWTGCNASSPSCAPR